ncbi:amidohydrolase [Haloimpatiens sp. FM7315]|uniref:amidohydrolase n=1 Tax=Haloimpatiens sp. FM7315 TaxID=3298609 RepID=UPI00370B1E29
MAVFINGKVITLDGRKISQGFSVRNGVFHKVGTNEEILKIKEPKEKVIDLKGKTVVPGFNDAHMHFLNYAITKSKVNIRSISSIEDMVNRTKKYIEDNKIPKGQWVTSRGWNENLFKEKRLPNRFDLDKISQDNPIFFHRICGHIGVCNTKALELLGLLYNVPEMKDGVIDVEKGKPTGILRENAINLILDRLPALKKDEIKALLKSAFEDALKVGLTSIQTEDVGHAGSLLNLLEAYRELDKEEELKIRMSLQLWLPSCEDIISGVKCISKVFNKEVGDYELNSDFLKISCVKLYEDGSLGGRTAAMKEPYLDTLDKGVSVYSREELGELKKEANKWRLPLAVHCIGDRASDLVLDAFEKFQDKDLRDAIVHCQFTNKEMLKRFEKLKVIANVQPSFVMSDYNLVDRVIPKKVANESYSWGSMLKNNIMLCFSSDAPIESFNPIQSIYGAVTRKDLLGNPQKSWHKEEKISAFEALKCQTLGSSYMSRDEKNKGSIEEGKFADFVVLSDNILEVKEDNIKDIKVIKTYVGGELMYSI